MALISVAVGIVAPQLIHALRGWEISSEARILRGWIRHAQQLAMTTQKTHRIHFLQTHYDVEAVSGTGEIEPLAQVVLRHSVTLHGDRPYLTFDALGAPEGRTILKFLPREGNPPPQATLEVAPITGRVMLSQQLSGE